MMGFSQKLGDMRSTSIRGTQLAGSLCPKAARPRNAQRSIECTATTGVKLPATHLQSSQASLQQLQSTKGVNRE
jgi:hypothetical protein